MKKQLSILLIMLTVASAQWTEPILFDSNEDTVGVNTPSGQEWCPFLSADGQYFYFTREHVNNDIYVCHREGEGWSEPLKLPFCETARDERNPTTNATNDTIYFIAFASGWNILWSFRTGECDTCWGPAELMPAPINSNGIEFSVWCTPDNQRLLFSSWRDGGIGGEDIYECRRDPNTETGWTNPLLLAGEINTWRIDSYPSMSMDTSEMFFARSDGRYYSSVLTGSGWTEGDTLPHDLVVLGMATPAISPIGDRLYFCRFRDIDTTVNAGDIWYADRPLSVPNIEPRDRQHHGFQIEIYPNPVRENFWIMTQGGINKATIFDLLGRRIATEEFFLHEDVVSWNLQSLHNNISAGTYFLVGQNRTEQRTVKFQIIR